MCHIKKDPVKIPGLFVGTNTVSELVNNKYTFNYAV
jgi:hypothetical protein